MPFVPLDQVAQPPRRGFVPLADVTGAADGPQAERRGFVPIADIQATEPERPAAVKPNEVLRNVALENPATAAMETGANLVSQMVALPAAGIAGLATAGAKALGLTDWDPVTMVHAVGEKLTYQPRGEMGRQATEAVMVPFEKLAEAGQGAGNAVLDATGSPAAATAVDTAINALPMAIAPGIKAGKAGLAKARGWIAETKAPTADAVPAVEPRGFIPLEEINAEQPVSTGAQRLVRDAAPLPESAEPGLEVLRRQGGDDLPPVAGELQELPGRHGASAEPDALAGKAGRGGELRADELRLDDASSAGEQARILPQGDGGRAGTDGRHGIAIAGDAEPKYRAAPADERAAARAEGSEALPAVDLADPRRGDPAAAGVVAADGVVDGRPALSDRGWDAAGPDPASGIAPKAARYALIEAENLKASHDVYLRPQDANPFGRQDATRHDNEMAVQGIVKDFEPARLVDALDDAHGAPIVAADGVVEVGQRRAIALKRVYQANGQKAEAYRQHLRENAGRLGFEPAAIDQMRKPVLVRLPDEPAPRRPAVADLAPDIYTDTKYRRTAPDQAEVMDMAAGVQKSWAPGTNYVPLRDAISDAVRAPETATRAKPIRREDVLRPFLEALDINVYHGRVKGKRLGYYMPKKETLRVKNKSDLEVTAHEIGHALDDRIPAIRAAWRVDKELRAELKGISYDKNSVPEGYAEAVRLWLTNPEALETAAPKAYGWLETFADTHPYGEAMRNAQAGMVSWFEQSALDRAKSKIGDPTSLNNRGLLPFLSDKWKAMRKGFRQAVVDDLDGIRLAEMNLTGKISSLGAYETARLTRAAGSITDGAVRFGHPVKKADGSFTYSGKGLEEILRPVAGRLDDFMTYAVGRSARELMQQGREHLFSPAEIRAAVALETPEFRTAWTEYQAWNRGVLDFAESFGILNPETRKLWKRQEYLPFWRVGQGVSGEGAVSGQWAGVKGLKGGTGNLREPLQNMVQNANALITAALKNEARARVVEMIEKERGGGKFMQRIPAEASPVKIDAKQVQEAVLKDMGIDDRAGLSAEGAKFAALVEKQIAEAPEFYQFFVGGQAPKGKNIVAVMKAGKSEYYEVADPLLLRALQAIDRPAQSWIIKLLGLPKRVGQASIVLDPTFMAANFARDQMMAGIMTQSGFRPIIDAMDGMRRRMTTDPLYREWVANGGGMSSLFLDKSAFRAKLERFYSSQGVDYRTVIDSPKKLLGMIETFGDAFESATRIGEMKRALEQGDHPRHAAYKSREVSVDFSQAGDLPAIRAAYDLVMFLRPTVVSWDRLYRGIRHDPNRGIIAAKTAMLGLASAALYLMNRGDPRYDDMSDFLKDSHFHVFLGDHHFMIPRPFEPGAIGRITELAVEKVMNEDPEGLGADLARVIGNTFHLNLMPQIAAPLVEQYANKNMFTGAPIETPDHSGLQPFLRAKPSTSETMKAAGMATRDVVPDSMKDFARRTWGITDETFQVSPARAEALLRGYLNSWAAYALTASDRLAVGKNLPEMRVDEMPVVRRFYQSEPPKHTKFESQFYEYLAASKRLRGTMRELDEMGLRTYADEKERGPLSGEAKPLERAAKNLSGINRDMEAVRRDGNLSPAGKREKLDALTVERNALLKAAVTESKKVQKAKALTPADIAAQGIR